MIYDLPMLLPGMLVRGPVHGMQGLFELRESKSLNLPIPNPGQPGCDDWA
jgi:hypothetical protein